MTDVVVTVPKDVWAEWLEEGSCPDDALFDPEDEYCYSIGGECPRILRGERVYIVAHGRLRGFAPLVRIEEYAYRSFGLIRADGAEALTIAAPIPGFRGWRYRWWDRKDERPFPDWRTEGVILAAPSSRRSPAEQAQLGDLLPVTDGIAPASVAHASATGQAGNVRSPPS